MELDFSKYKPLIITALCKTICPDINPEFIDQQKIQTQLNFYLETYTRTILEDPKDEGLCQKLEEIMISKLIKSQTVIAPEQNCMNEAQFRVKQRYTLDLNEATRGHVLVPRTIWLTVYQHEYNKTTGRGYEFYNEHPIRCWSGLPYPLNATYQDLHNMIRKNNFTYDKSTFRVFLPYQNNKTLKPYSTTDLLGLWDTTNEIGDYSFRHLNDLVCLDHHIINMIVVFSPRPIEPDESQTTDSSTEPSSKKAKYLQ